MKLSKKVKPLIEKAKKQSRKEVLDQVWRMSQVVWIGGDINETAKINHDTLKDINLYCAAQLNNMKLDRNASDSECFEHDHWEKDSLNRKIRVGKCKITGAEVRVEPGQPGENSGQPIECYEHFELRRSYLK